MTSRRQGRAGGRADVEAPPPVAFLPIQDEDQMIDRWVWPECPKPVWGPIGWDWLHRLTINYPDAPCEADARLALRRVWNFYQNLPCVIECRRHAITDWHKHPPEVRTGPEFQQWGWAFHNRVNARLGKPQFTFAQFRQRYKKDFETRGL